MAVDVAATGTLLPPRSRPPIEAAIWTPDPVTKLANSSSWGPEPQFGKSLIFTWKKKGLWVICLHPSTLLAPQIALGSLTWRCTFADRRRTRLKQTASRTESCQGIQIKEMDSKWRDGVIFTKPKEKDINPGNIDLTW